MAKRGRPKRKDLDQIDQLVAAKAYVQNDWTIQEIADTLDASYWEVRAVLIRHGVKLRKRGRRSS